MNTSLVKKVNNRIIVRTNGNYKTQPACDALFRKTIYFKIGEYGIAQIKSKTYHAYNGKWMLGNEDSEVKYFGNHALDVLTCINEECKLANKTFKFII